MPAGSADLDEPSKNGNLQLLESVSGRHIGCLIPSLTNVGFWSIRAAQTSNMTDSSRCTEAVRTVLLTRAFTTLGNRRQNPTPRKPAWILDACLRL